MNSYAWLGMMGLGEASYNAHLDQIDVAMPINGGVLQADGTWEQSYAKTSSPWAQSLPTIAASAGHLYMPTVGCNSATIATVLDSPELQETAAQNLVTLATTDRYDSPWDGVVFDLEGILSVYKPQLSQFLYTLSYHVRRAGLQCVVATRGKASDPGPDYDDAYSYDFSVVAQVSDFTILMCYGYWAPTNVLMDRSLAPYWWIDDCIQYALGQGIPAQRLTVGAATYCSYYPNSGSGIGRTDVSYNDAMQLASDANAKAAWVEHNDFGLVRERLADLGPGHVWIHDGDTLRHSLNLVKQYNLDGCAQFVLGFEDARCWDVLNGY